MIGETISHYRILEMLGEGGMGVVYRAEDTKLRRPVALKFLPPGLARDTEAKERFVREAQAASALNHPNICTIHEIEEDNGRVFIAMACIDGESLKDRIERGPLAPMEALDIAAQVAEGLADAHEHGIVHRDIKPGNIMLTAKGRAKITDFGLAKVRGTAQLTRTGTSVGTTAYMSPEQARAGDVDHRTDIWSLGVVLYEMLTGQRPFRGDYEQAVIYSVLHDDPEPPTTLAHGAPCAVDDVVAKMLAKDPTSRYSDACEAVADLKGLMEHTEASTSARRAAADDARPSIAVLPFANMSADPEQEYFCDGMTEEIINVLAHVEGLRVIARTSSFVFKEQQQDIREIGRKLDVASLLEGSVRKAGNRLRITAQLVSVADGSHLWSERYDREVEDVFAVQDEISQAIVDALKVKLLGTEKAAIERRRTDRPEAYGYYLKGRFFWDKRTREGFFKGIECFEKAIERDPGYALAYTGLADSYNGLVTYGHLSPEEGCEKAREAAAKALELDDSLAEAHASMGWVLRDADHDLKAAEREFKRAIALSPGYTIAHHWYAFTLRQMGRFRDARKEQEIALALDPLSMPAKLGLTFSRVGFGDWAGADEIFRQAIEMDPASGLIRALHAELLLEMGRTEEAIAEAERSLELAPEEITVRIYYGMVLYYRREYDRAIEHLSESLKAAPFSDFARFFLGMTYAQKGMYEEALAEVKQSLADSSREDTASRDAALGAIYARMGRPDEARKILAELEERAGTEYVPPVFLADVCVALGDRERAMQYLNDACEKGDPEVGVIGVDPLYDGVRDDPEFQEIMRRAGLER